MAKTFLDEAKVKYKYVDAEDKADLAKEFDITAAPTLVVTKKGNTEKFANLSNIRKFIEEK